MFSLQGDRWPKLERQSRDVVSRPSWAKPGKKRWRGRAPRQRQTAMPTSLFSISRRYTHLLSTTHSPTQPLNHSTTELLSCSTIYPLRRCLSERCGSALSYPCHPSAHFIWHSQSDLWRRFGWLSYGCAVHTYRHMRPSYSMQIPCKKLSYRSILPLNKSLGAATEIANNLQAHKTTGAHQRPLLMNHQLQWVQHQQP